MTPVMPAPTTTTSTSSLPRNGAEEATGAAWFIQMLVMG